MTYNAGLPEDLGYTKQTENRQHRRLENKQGKLVRSPKKWAPINYQDGSPVPAQGTMGHRMPHA